MALPDTKAALSAVEQYRDALATLESTEFRHADAGRKQDILWDFISSWPYRNLPPLNMTVLQLLIRLLNRANLRQAFDVNADIRPPHAKAFHPCGTVAKIRFIADREQPYTGIFNTGALGFARLSLAMGEKNFGPSTAFKFLIDGPYRSENLVVDQSLDTQTSRDFFERVPTNHTLPPTQYPLKLIWPVVNWWLAAIADPLYQPLDHLAEIDATGRRAESPLAPRLIYFYGADELHTDPRTTEDFRIMLTAIPPGTTLFRVFGRAAPAAAQTYLGVIQTQSYFVASEFGDRILSLRHTKSPEAIQAA